MKEDERITKEEILLNWGEYYLERLVDLLNKDYGLEEAIADIKSFRVENGTN